jgi:hypothetical protein
MQFLKRDPHGPPTLYPAGFIMFYLSALLLKARYGTLLKDASASELLSGPRLGLLEKKVVDTIKSLPRRPRLGPQFRAE